MMKRSLSRNQSPASPSTTVVRPLLGLALACLALISAPLAKRLAPATAAAQCPPQTVGVTHEILGNVYDDVSGLEIPAGGNIRRGVQLRLHTKGTANGYCQTMNPDCTNGAQVEHLVSQIKISVDVMTGTSADGTSEITTISGIDPPTGQPQAYHVLDSRQPNATGGPGLYTPPAPGTYKFNFIMTTNATPCNIQPSDYTASVTIQITDTIDTLNNGDWTRPAADGVLMGSGDSPVGGHGTTNTSATPISANANPTNSNIYHREADLEFLTVGGAVPLVRHYNKLTKRDGQFGYGWTSLFDVSLSEQGPTQVRLLREDGSTVFFKLTDLAGRVYFPFTPHVFHGQVLKETDGTYRLEEKNGWVYRFNQAGYLISVADRNGNAITLTRDTLGRVVRVNDPFGRQYDVFYPTLDSGIHVQSIKFNDEAIARYTYGGVNNVDVTYADGAKYVHTYNNFGLIRVRDALDNVLVKWTLDAGGRITAVERDGGVEKLSYNYVYVPPSGTIAVTSPGETDVTDALGRVTKYFFVNSSNASCSGNNCPLKAVSRNAVIRSERESAEGNLINTFVLDANDNLIFATDPLNRTTSYSYDEDGHLLTLTDVLGAMSFSYNLFGQVLTATDRMGGVTRNTYDSNGNLLSTTDVANAQSTFTYNALGQVVTATDPRGITASFTYNTGRLASQSIAGGHTTTFAYHPRGWLTGVTDALNHSTSYTLDLVGRVKTVTDPVGAPPFAASATYTYDLAGRRTKVADGLGHETQYSYDGAYRLLTETNVDNRTTTYSYDKQSNLRSVTDPLGRETNLVYDDLDRLHRVNYPPAQTTEARLFERYEYDAGNRLTRRFDTAGRDTRYFYDLGDRVVREQDPAGNDTRYQYNPRSQVLQVTDALSQRYQYEYDPLGRVTRLQRGGREWSFSYDGNGNRSSRTDAKGNTTSYSYNELNNLTAITYANGGTQTYAYDVLGRMMSATNNTGTVTLAYDGRGRVTGTTDVWGQALSYEYDNNNNRKKLTLGASQTTYAYDVLDRVLQMTHNSVGTTAFAYDAVSRLTTRTLANGVAATAQYDGLDRLTRLTYAKGVNTLADWQHQFNTASQITQISEPGGVRSYSYDVLDRLTAATQPLQPNESYAYDAVGNRTASHRSAIYNYLSFNRLSGV